MPTPLRRRLRHTRRFVGYGVLVVLVLVALLVGIANQLLPLAERKIHNERSSSKSVLLQYGIAVHIAQPWINQIDDITVRREPDLAISCGRVCSRSPVTTSSETEVASSA